ncbi:hypothetical protein IW492_11885 [Enterococcus sp. BWB1-3]|uniref:hypothetical protein n=1 Tax=Enterococcus sp. BWB1-3 TaxID=2787713 RepID=UPI001921F45D|nr:hypothetical protein [Enterococcus sp. BWB1-3]MBL1229933.1 hypothetical protein [Enterococcus sp. BWB1-3]
MYEKEVIFCHIFLLALSIVTLGTSNAHANNIIPHKIGYTESEQVFPMTVSELAEETKAALLAEGYTLDTIHLYKGETITTIKAFISPAF